MPAWMQTVTKDNPVTWAVAIGRQALNSSVDWSLIGRHLAELLALTLACAWFATRAFALISARPDSTHPRDG